MVDAADVVSGFSVPKGVRLPSWCDDAIVFDLPMTLKFRGITRRQGMLLHGVSGWAEWSPFIEYGPDEAATWLAATREACTHRFPDPVRNAVPVNVTVPAVDSETAHRVVTNSACRTAKVKVGGESSFADDIARVEAVRDALGPDGKVRVDVNGTWTVDQAIERLRVLSRFNLEYAEQPVMAVEDLAELRRELARRGINVLIAADESIRRAEDPWKVRQLEAADVAVVKVQPLGGVRAALRMAEELQLPTVVSSALDSSIGLRMGLALAAALPELPHACGLNTGALLAEDMVSQDCRVTEQHGELSVSSLEIGRQAVNAEGKQASTETANAWFSRLALAAERLEER